MKNILSQIYISGVICAHTTQMHGALKGGEAKTRPHETLTNANVLYIIK